MIDQQEKPLKGFRLFIGWCVLLLGVSAFAFCLTSGLDLVQVKILGIMK